MEVNRGIVGGMVGEMVKGIPVTTTGVVVFKRTASTGGVGEGVRE